VTAPVVAAEAAPQNLDAEESVLGKLLLAGADGLSDDERLAEVVALLRPEDFYRESHGMMFAAIVRLHAAGAPLDPISVVAELEGAGELERAGGRVRVIELAGVVTAWRNVPHHARLVRETARLRELLRVLEPIVAAAHAGSLDAAEAVGALDRAHALLEEATRS
jgi:replicative DNA helicase